MSTGYKIDFTDQNPNRSFELAPFTTNGPVTPLDETLDARATDAVSTLLLYGKGAPDYGERIQENILHLSENFASAEEPAYPINGQFWYDVSDPTAPQMRIYNAFKYQVVAGDNAGNQWFAITPTTDEDKAELLARFVINKKATVIDDPSTHNKERYSVLTNAFENTSLDVEFSVAPTPATARTGWYIGGWEYSQHSNAVLRENWELNDFPFPTTTWTITNVPDPVGNWDVTNKTYVDTSIATAIAASNELGELIDVVATVTSSASAQDILMFNGSLWENTPVINAIVPLAGNAGTPMTGPIDMGGNDIYNLPVGVPPTAQSASSRQYVDDQIALVTGTVPTLLNDLGDVSSGGAIANDILRYDGIQWLNVDPATFAADHDIVTENVSPIFTVPVYIPAIAPVANNEVAN